MFESPSRRVFEALPLRQIMSFFCLTPVPLVMIRFLKIDIYMVSYGIKQLMSMHASIPIVLGVEGGPNFGKRRTRAVKQSPPRAVPALRSFHLANASQNARDVYGSSSASGSPSGPHSHVGHATVMLG